MDIQVSRVSETAILPTKAHSGDAGWDLYADVPVQYMLNPQVRTLVPIGWKIRIPEGYYGRIADRSGNSWKYGLHVLGAVIDSGYRGQVKVILVNLGANIVNVKSGDKIAQMVITKIHTGGLVEVEELDNTERGEGGFGSSDPR